MFIDAKQRNIKIAEDYGDIEAFHDGKKIGSIQFDSREDDYDCETYLFGMDVNPDYQKAGIGVEMMRLAAEIHGKDFSKPSFSAVGGFNAESSTYYTAEGAALIRKCIKLDILSDTDTQDIYDNDEYDE